MGTPLLEGEEAPDILVNGGGRSPYLLISEHASNRLPKALGTLGLPESELQRHIAWDLGRSRSPAGCRG
jgi:predicted N-formylglutamate amidohydrolase